MLQFSKRTREPEDETLELIEEIRNTRERLTRIDRWFALEDDEDLIDACIYEREAVCARYRYLLKKAQSLGASFEPFLEAGEKA